jgi:hypothetical protein
VELKNTRVEEEPILPARPSNQCTVPISSILQFRQRRRISRCDNGTPEQKVLHLLVQGYTTALTMSRKGELWVLQHSIILTDERALLFDHKYLSWGVWKLHQATIAST